MGTPTRRAILRAAGAGVPVGLSGCSSLLPDGDETTRLCFVTVRNIDGLFGEDDGTAYAAELELLDGDDLVESVSEELPPPDGGEITAELSITAADVPSYEGEFLARTRVEGDEWVDMDLAAYAVDPIAAHAEINAGGDVGWNRSHSDRTDCQYIPAEDLQDDE